MMKIFRTALWCVLFSVANNVVAQPSGNTGALRIVLPEVQFSKEKTNIQPAGLQELKAVAVLLKKNPYVRTEIQAHTDASGSASYNLRLSQKRAVAVRDVLVKSGISPKRLAAKGFGEAKPLNRCGRGANCTDEEKRENRRVELHLKGLPADSAARAPWLQLAGVQDEKPLAAPTVPKMAPENSVRTRRLPEANNSVPLPKPVQGNHPPSEDYFPELSEGKPPAPKPLPHTFTGYSIELACTDKPLPAGSPLFRKFEPVYLRDEPGGGYCYYIGAFFTLPEARQFLQEKALKEYPKARVVAFSEKEKLYLTN